MSVSAALPRIVDELRCENVLTFIVPAPDGCNLGCPFCFIDRRSESATHGILGAADYTRFIWETATSKQAIDAVCVQGYEPLLPASFLFTKAILQAAQRLGLPTGLVTNGTYLAQRAAELAEFAPDKIAVSLDATIPEVHDRQRHRSGAWHQTVVGLLTALEVLPATTEVAVTSVLMPKKSFYLQEMPEFLNRLGVDEWIISTLLKFGKNQNGGIADDVNNVFRDIVELSRKAARYNINFSIDDNLDALSNACIEGDSIVDINALRIRRLPTLSSLIRLLPTGQCLTGYQMLAQVPMAAPIWLPGSVNAGDFIRRIRI